MDILLVDDSKAMRLIVKRTIRSAGFGGHSFQEAKNGKEGLRMALETSPNLIISDWNMPFMTGIQFLNELRSQEVNIPFGFVTSEGTASARETARAAGALFLICKPFTAEDFREALLPVVPNAN